MANARNAAPSTAVALSQIRHFPVRKELDRSHPDEHVLHVKPLAHSTPAARCGRCGRRTGQLRSRRCAGARLCRPTRQSNPVIGARAERREGPHSPSTYSAGHRDALAANCHRARAGGPPPAAGRPRVSPLSTGPAEACRAARPATPPDPPGT